MSPTRIAGRGLIEIKAYSFTLDLVLCSFAAENQKLHKLDRYIDYIEQYNQGTRVISVLNDGKQVYPVPFQTGYPGKWNKHMQYQIGSVTKVYTAVLIWKRTKADRLGLNTYLDGHLHQMVNQKNHDQTAAGTYSSTEVRCAIWAGR